MPVENEKNCDEQEQFTLNNCIRCLHLIYIVNEFLLHRLRNLNRAFYHSRSITGEFMLVIASLNAMKSQELSSVLAEHAHEVGSCKFNLEW